MAGDSATPSGARTQEDGTKIVGGSRRADGSLRKSFKVRPGFVAAEDVTRYAPPRRRLQERQSERKEDRKVSESDQRQPSDLIASFEKLSTSDEGNVLKSSSNPQTSGKSNTHKPGLEKTSNMQQSGDQSDKQATAKGHPKPKYVPPHLRKVESKE